MALDMALQLHLRALTDDEPSQIARLVRAQRAPVRLVCRARIISPAAEGLAVPASAHQVHIREKAVRQRLRCVAALEREAGLQT